MAERERVDLLIRDGVVLTMVDGAGVVEGDVAIAGGRIVDLGRGLDVEAERTIDARGNAVLPGLVNAHMHETLERGLFEDLPFMRWLQEFALPKDIAYEPRHMRAAALLNQLEMIRGGTTAFVDIFRFPEEAAAVAEGSGLRATFSPQLIDEPKGAGETLESSVAFVEAWRERVPDRIRTWFGPHSLYSVDEATFGRIRELANRYGVGVHTHVAESEAETEIVRDRTGGLTPTSYLDRLLGLGPDVSVAHAIHLTDDDLALLVEREVGIGHCPTSNMKLGNGVARVPDLVAAGARLGLGTDSVMTNNNLDMFEEMRQAGLLQKLARRDATVLSAPDLLRLATIGSARALGLDGEVGTLEVGKRADLIVVDLHVPHAWPTYRQGRGNVVEHLVWSSAAADVLTTIVDGRVLMEDRRVLSIEAGDIEELVDRESRHLLAKAGVLERVIGGEV